MRTPHRVAFWVAAKMAINAVEGAEKLDLQRRLKKFGEYRERDPDVKSLRHYIVTARFRSIGGENDSFNLRCWIARFRPAH